MIKLDMIPYLSGFNLYDQGKKIKNSRLDNYTIVHL
jgi:hypothetical protein